MKATATITIKGVFDTADYAEPQEFVAELREAALHALEPHIDVQGSSVGIALNYSVSQPGTRQPCSNPASTRG